MDRLQGTRGQGTPVRLSPETGAGRLAKVARSPSTPRTSRKVSESARSAMWQARGFPVFPVEGQSMAKTVPKL